MRTATKTEVTQAAVPVRAGFHERNEIAGDLGRLTRAREAYERSYHPDHAQEFLTRLDQAIRLIDEAGPIGLTLNSRRMACDEFAKCAWRLSVTTDADPFTGVAGAQRRDALEERCTNLPKEIETATEREFVLLKEAVRDGTLRGTALSDILKTFPPGLARAAEYRDANLFADRLLGISDIPAPAGDGSLLQRQMQPNHATNAAILPRLMEAAALKPGDVFYDIGSGYGRVVMVTALLSPAAVRGVEADPYAANKSRELIAQSCINAKIIEGNALTADISDGSVFYLNAPFFGSMMTDFLTRLRVQARNTDVRVITHGQMDRWLGDVPGFRALTDRQEPFGIFKVRALRESKA